MDNPFDAAEREVLAENTAQSILKTLNRLEEKKTILGARWIWELLQNARDAAQTTTVSHHATNRNCRCTEMGRKPSFDGV